MTVSKLLAPFCPFIADEIYDNLDGSEPSVHLTDFPEAGPRDVELEVAMGVVREAVRLGLAARGQAKLGVRQPLRAAVVVAAGGEREAIERLEDIVKAELNVKELRFVSQADELGSYEVKPNYRALGPRFGKHMPQVAAAVAALEPGPRRRRAARRPPRRRQRRRRGAPGSTPTTCCWPCSRSRATSSSARARTRSRSSSSSTTSWAARASRARSSTRSRTRARRPGLEVADRIELTLGGDAELLDAARAFEAT